MIRFSGADVSETGRATLGVHLIRLADDTAVATMAKVAKEDETADDDATTAGETTAPAEDSASDVATTPVADDSQATAPDSDAPEA